MPGDGAAASPFPPAGSGQYEVRKTVTGNDGAASGPWLLPPFYGPGSTTPGTLTVVVPRAAPSTASAFTAIGNDDFAVSRGSDGSLTVTGTGNVWNADAEARSTLWQSYTGLRDALEAAEATCTLAPGTTTTVMSRVAEALPVPFDELLAYRHALQPTARYVDLTPGMRLRVEAATGEFAGLGAASSFNGFVGSGTSHWTVTRRAADQALLFDAFVGGLAAYPPPDGGGWGLAALQAAGAFRYWRLLYPARFADWPGSVDPAQNISFVGASAYADIGTATDAYLAGAPIPPKGAGPIAVTYLAGRAVVVPEIAVRLGPAVTYVPVGTTLADATQRLAPPGLASAAAAFALTRAWSADGTWKPVNTTGDPAVAPDCYPWPLPLVQGDAIGTPGPS